MASGYWPLSWQQLHDLNGRPYPGARAFFYEAATLDPLDVFKEYDLINVHPSPVIADGYGIFPAIFLDVDDLFYRFRVTTSAGVIIIDEQQAPIIGPTAGEEPAEPATPVDPEALFLTGDMKVRLGTGFHEGWVRLNGLTIGAVGSGATERAAADTEALFTLIWTNFSDTLCPVVGGRGASAATDFAIPRAITLPDSRGRAIVGLDDMGGAVAGRLTSTTLTPDGITLGASGGAQTITLTTAQLASHDHGATASSGAHKHFIAANVSSTGNLTVSNQVMYRGALGGDETYELQGTDTAATLGLTSEAIAHSHTTASAGGGTAHNNVQPSIAFTIYCKL